MLPKILLVDDEEHVLSGYKRNLRNNFDVETADSGQLGLKKVKNEGPFAVVISDFKMPEMNGNQFLKGVKTIAPDTVRMMLTGYADLSSTIDAVNDGNIFRLLTKPCPLEKLIASINDGVRQYDLISTEKTLLDKTLKGTIKMLIEILSVVNPIAFSRASRFQKFVPQISNLLNIKNVWELEIATLLSQIGLVTMPPDVLAKKINGEQLPAEQEEVYNQHPVLAKSLLVNIPRLENIAQAIYYQFHPFENKNEHEKSGEDLPIASRILNVLSAFDNFVTSGLSFQEACNKLKKNEIDFDQNVVVALDASIAGIYQHLKLFTVMVENLEAGVVSASDIRDKNGQVLITKGAEITSMMKMKLINYVKMGVINPEIKILK